MKSLTHAAVIAPTPATAAARSRPALVTRSDVIAAPPIVAAPIADSPIAALTATPAAVAARPGHQLGRFSIHPPLLAGVQAKLTVSQPDDKYEQEADRVADEVMRMPVPGAPARPGEDDDKTAPAVQAKPAGLTITPWVQRQADTEEPEEEEPVQARPLVQRQSNVKEEEEESVQTRSLLQQRVDEAQEEEEPLQTRALIQRQAEGEEVEEAPVQTKARIQRRAGDEDVDVDDEGSVLQAKSPRVPTVASDLEARLRHSQGQGQPLHEASRAYFEPRFGFDFSKVRVHADGPAGDATRRLNAQAFTLGQDVFFGAGRFLPDTTNGRSLLGHELTHVVQQGAAPLLSRPTPHSPATTHGGAPAPIARRIESVDADTLLPRRDADRGSTDEPGGHAERLVEPASEADDVGPRSRARGLVTSVRRRMSASSGRIRRRPLVAAAETRAASERPRETAVLAGESLPTPPSLRSARTDAAVGLGEKLGRQTGEVRATAQRLGDETETRVARDAAADSAATEAGGDAATIPHLADLLERAPEAPPTTTVGESGVAAESGAIGEGGAVGTAAAESHDTEAASAGVGEVAASPVTESGGSEAAAAASERLTTGGADAEARIHAGANAARSEFSTRASHARRAVASRVKQSVAAIRQQFATHRNNATAAINAARGQIESQLSASRATAMARGQTARTAIATVFSGHRNAVNLVISDNVTEAEQLRTHYANHVHTMIANQAATARRRGEECAAGYPDSERGRIQANAAYGVAEAVAQEMEAREPEAIAGIEEVTRDIPGQFVQAGRDALNGFDNGLPDLLVRVDEQVGQIVTMLEEQAQQARRQMEEMQQGWAQQLDEAEAAALERVYAIQPQAEAEIDRGWSAARRATTRAARDSTATIGRVVGEGRQILADTPDPDPASAEAFADSVLGWVDGMASETGEALDAAVDGVGEALARARPTANQGLTAIQQRVTEQLDAAATARNARLTGFVEDVDGAYADTLRQQDEGFNTAEHEIRERLEPDVRTLRSDFETTRRDAEGRIREAVNEGLGKNDEALGELGGRMRSAASDAAWDYDHPILATLRDIGAIVLGVIVGILAVIALVVVVIVAIKVIAIGLVVAGLTAATALLVAKIVVLGGLLVYAGYQAYQAYEARRAAGESAGSAALGVLQDFTGITSIRRAFGEPGLSPFERGRLFGEGAATLVLTLLGARRLFGRFRTQAPPSVPRPRPRLGAPPATRAPAPRAVTPTAPTPPEPTIGFGRTPRAPTTPTPEPTIGFGRIPRPPMTLTPEPTIGFGRTPRAPTTPTPEPTIGFGRTPRPPATPTPEPTIGFGRTPRPPTTPTPEPTIGFGRTPRPPTTPTPEPTVGPGRATRVGGPSATRPVTEGPVVTEPPPSPSVPRVLGARGAPTTGGVSAEPPTGGTPVRAVASRGAGASPSRPGTTTPSTGPRPAGRVARPRVTTAARSARGGRAPGPANNPNPGWGWGQIPCFPPGTPVSTPLGLKPIEALAVGEEIHAYDFATHAVVLCPVEQIFTGTTNCWIDIRFTTGAVRATRSHPFWVESAQRWVEAVMLAPGMTVRLLEGGCTSVESVVVATLDDGAPTYNLHVRAVNNFFAGERLVLVHNATPLSQPGHSVYVLRNAGRIYYVGRFGPGETLEDVEYRHGRTPSDPALRRAHGARYDPSRGDSIEVARRNLTYGEARRLEHELCVRHRTHIGRSPTNWRGNRDYPMSPRRFRRYYLRNAC